MKKPNNIILAQDLASIFTTFIERFDERIQKNGPPRLSADEYAKLMITISLANNFNDALNNFFQAAHRQVEDPRDTLLEDEEIVFEFDDADDE